MVNPDQIQDRTQSQKLIPAKYLRSEEKLKQTIAYLHAELQRHKVKSKRYDDIEKDIRKQMDRLVQQQQAISKMMREQDNTPELFEVPKFLKGKKRA